MKKLISLILTCVMLSASAGAVFAKEYITSYDPPNKNAAADTAGAGETVSILVNGEKVECDVEPFIENDRTLVPFRAVGEALGAAVDWNGDTRTAALSIDGKTVSVTADSDELLVSGDADIAVPLDTPAVIKNDRMFIPVRAVSEALGCAVAWEDETRTVVINNTYGNDVIGVPETPSPSSEASPAMTANPDMNFASNLMSLMPDDKNYMVSPLSLRIALMMLANGVEGETRTELLNALGVSDIDAENESIKEFIAKYNESSSDNIEGEPGNPEMKLANSVWINTDTVGEGVDFSDAYSKKLTEYYSAESNTVTNTDAVEKINAWVSDATNKKIDSIISDPSFAASLINAVYMKASWQNQFNESATEKADFTDRNGNVSQIDFMNDTDHYMYYSDGETTAVRLPYYGGPVMYIVMGDADPARLGGYIENMTNKKVALSIPKWKTENTLDLNDTLKALGIEKAFAGGADFEGMLSSGAKNLYLSSVLQKTYISVDEYGTEAAAVTMAVGGMTSMSVPEEIIEFKADEPFTYFICDGDTNEIIFMGEYVAPDEG